MRELIDRRFVRFVIAGGVATLVHVVLFVVLLEGAHLDATAASIPAFAVALLASYLLNWAWTFEASSSLLARLPQFIVVAAVGLVVNVALTLFVVDALRLHYAVALALVVTITPIVTFWLNRQWTFGGTSASSTARSTSNAMSAHDDRRFARGQG